jgi:hypothetical protein
MPVKVREWISPAPASPNPVRSLMNIRDQIFLRIGQSQKSFPAHARCRFSEPTLGGIFRISRHRC